MKILTVLRAQTGQLDVEGVFIWIIAADVDRCIACAGGGGFKFHGEGRRLAGGKRGLDRRGHDEVARVRAVLGDDQTSKGTCAHIADRVAFSDSGGSHRLAPKVFLGNPIDQIATDRLLDCYVWDFWQRH